MPLLARSEKNTPWEDTLPIAAGAAIVYEADRESGPTAAVVPTVAKYRRFISITVIFARKRTLLQRKRKQKRRAAIRYW